MSPVFEKYAIDNIISLQRLRQQKQSHLDAIYNCKKHCVAVILFRFFADPVLSCSSSWATYFRIPLDRVRYDSYHLRFLPKNPILLFCLFYQGFRPKTAKSCVLRSFSFGSLLILFFLALVDGLSNLVSTLVHGGLYRDLHGQCTL